MLDLGFSARAARPETNRICWQSFKGSRALLQNRETAFGEGRCKPHSPTVHHQQDRGMQGWQHKACVTPAKQRTHGTGVKEEDSHRFPVFLSYSPLQTPVCAPTGRAQLSQLWPLPTPTTASRTHGHRRAPQHRLIVYGRHQLHPRTPPGHTEGCPSAPYTSTGVTRGHPWVPLHPTRAQGVTRGHPGVPPHHTHLPALQGVGQQGGARGGPAATPRRAQGGAAAARRRRTARAADTFACARCNVRSSNFLATYVQPGHSCF